MVAHLGASATICTLGAGRNSGVAQQCQCVRLDDLDEWGALSAIVPMTPYLDVTTRRAELLWPGKCCHFYASIFVTVRQIFVRVYPNVRRVLAFVRIYAQLCCVFRGGPGIATVLAS
jgi:hypothetical protein